MTSFGASKVILESDFMPIFKIQGQVYHRIGSVYHLPGEGPKFAEIYFIGDANEQCIQRCSNTPGVKPQIVVILQEVLHQQNELIRSFKCAAQ